MPFTMLDVFSKTVLLTITVLFLSACAGVKGNPDIQSISFLDVRKIEHQYYKNTDQMDKSLGLALSGGGTRSAAFNIGVLAGLHKISWLDDLDAISSVSGGSYAAYWYFSKQFYRSKYSLEDSTDDFFKYCYTNDECLDGVFEDKLCDDICSQNCIHSKCGKEDCTRECQSYRFQRHLTNNSLILKKHAVSSGSGDKKHFGHFIPIILRTIYEAPISNILELFGSDNNSYSARDYYREGIERTYGLYPVASNVKGLMECSFVGKDDSLYRSWSGEKYRAESLYLSSLQKELYSKSNSDAHMPVWIINTTVAPSNDFRFTRLYSNPYKSEPFRKSIYEITPFTIGSETTGFMSINDADQLKCNLMGDGDRCLRTVSDYVALSGAAVDVNPYTNFGGALGMTLISLFGVELGDYSLNPNKISEPAYLSDGGHSDNLGAYSLIKRGFKNIIISDAEADRNGEIQALRRLARQLRGDNKKIVFYRDRDRKIRNTELNLCLEAEGSQCLTIAYDESNGPRKARDWELPPILLANVVSDEGQVLSKIFYIKLRALDRYLKDAEKEGFPKYPQSTKCLLEKDKDIKKFPHVSTVDINFNPTQHFAYFTLGRFYGKALEKYLK